MRRLHSLLLTISIAVMLGGCEFEKSAALPAHCAVPPGNPNVEPFPGFQHFVTRDGIRLLDGNRPLRFIGLHATELHRIEDDVASADSRIGKSDHFRWPTAREQSDWVQALVYSGHTVTRIYTLSVDDISLPASVRANMPAHIMQNKETGEIGLNEEAMRVMDRLIYLADIYGLRLIIPVIDQWSWWGGKRELAQMVGEADQDTKESGPLYDIDSKTYAAYQHIIEQLLTRKNTCTGREYREEKAIMAWETGNELRGTNKAFLAKTAALFKGLAPNQLVIDGDQQADSVNAPGSASIEQGEFLGLADPNVDIQSNHFYGAYMSADEVHKQAELAETFNKPMIIGEYGLQPLGSMQAVTDAWLAEPSVAGGLVWGYRGHREAGGFYWHRESGGYMSYHLPGSAVNDANNELAVIQMIRKAQAKVSSSKRAQRFSTAWPVPQPPVLYPISKTGGVNWMGVPTGSYYHLYVSVNDGAEWKLLGDKLPDAENGWDPATMNLYTIKAGQDSDTESGCALYRLTAVNSTSESEPSNIQPYCAQ
ncbi:glycoside hydrolase family 2 TIM barrel-domain containing protein [Microbulbifer sp. SAOS-129_SWC]|uniref:glycoside hydrolase family 2 TIM barrel-domain containing protein n=1 Tax=Microbulbifer sp. SAOS-129_SWC TaxID=3145235 RepID=UPI0032176084